ncbi:MAG: sigma-54-dependent Fis family transcriptional regulator [Proteobacteria bacterium]|nr:sigma-54-dependent Fis family transcriptional regulator [Pseudomonadota bacterium]
MGTAPARRVLVVDDEESLRHMLGVILGRAGYEVLTASNGAEALELLDREEDLSLVLCDVRMPRLDGLGFLDGLGERRRRIHTVMMSAYGSNDLALEAMKRGAYDYVNKPFKPDEILLTLRKVEERERLALENDQLRAQMRGRTLEGMVGSSRAMRKLSDTVRKVAAYPSTVLITGESGSGKELVARSIHALSDRKDRPFVAVNCGAIPENLLESELFGHVRGAFTGAVRERAGLFEQAHGGTLLLDEIGEMPKGLQVKLLRVLQEHVLRRVGGSKDVGVDVRVVAATARDLEVAVADGDFRDDLFYRLNVVRLRMPPLRERTEDVPELANHFLEAFNERFDKRVRSVSPAAVRALVRFSWPGNVRQLENVMERAALMCEGDVIDVEDLPPDVVDGKSAELTDEVLSIKLRVAQLERELIIKALEQTGGNRTRAAKVLEISYKALVYKIRDFGIGD